MEKLNRANIVESDRDFKVSNATATLLECIDITAELHSRVVEVLLNYYGDNEVDEVSDNLLRATNSVADEIGKILGTVIFANRLTGRDLTGENLI